MEKKAKGDQELQRALLQNYTNMGIGSIYSQGHNCTRNRVCKHWNGGNEELGGGERRF